MTEFGMRIDGVGGRRRASRGSVLLPASVQTIGTYQTIELINISATGAKLRGSALPDEGKVILLRAGPFDLFGEIVWRRRDLCGIHFDEPLVDGDLDRIRRDGKVASIGMSPAEKEAAEDWVTGKAR